MLPWMPGSTLVIDGGDILGWKLSFVHAEQAGSLYGSWGDVRYEETEWFGATTATDVVTDPDRPNEILRNMGALNLQ